MNDIIYIQNLNDTFLTKAQNDATAALILAQAPNPPIENILQLASQCVEKYFKFLSDIEYGHLNTALYESAQSQIHSSLHPDSEMINLLNGVFYNTRYPSNNSKSIIVSHSQFTKIINLVGLINSLTPDNLLCPIEFINQN